MTVRLRFKWFVDERVIRAMFGTQAVPYDYTVTQDEFDRDHNQSPGHYFGIDVPVSLARRWDAGILWCKEAGVEPGSREGLRMRYQMMLLDDSAQMPDELADELAAYVAEKEVGDLALSSVD